MTLEYDCEDENMKYELVALDIDGTILNSDMKITNQTKEAIKMCVSKGIKVVLASGRYYESIKAYTKDLNISSGQQITLNGAVIKEAKTGKSLEEFPIPKEDYDNIIDKLEELPYSKVVFTADKYYKTICNGEIETVEVLTGPKAEMISSFKLVVNPIKILLIIEDEHEIEKARRILENDKYLVIRTGYNNVEIVRRDVSKGRTLKIIADKYNIKSEKIIAIGDSENDIEMIKYAGMGVAMGNAYDHVKEISDEVTETCDKDGAQKTINKYIFGAN